MARLSVDSTVVCDVNTLEDTAVLELLEELSDLEIVEEDSIDELPTTSLVATIVTVVVVVREGGGGSSAQTVLSIVTVPEQTGVLL